LHWQKKTYGIARTRVDYLGGEIQLIAFAPAAAPFFAPLGVYARVEVREEENYEKTL
jgi:hypothetical protein